MNQFLRSTVLPGESFNHTRHRSLLVLLIILVVVAIILLFIWWYIPKSDQSPPVIVEKNDPRITLTPEEVRRKQIQLENIDQTRTKLNSEQLELKTKQLQLLGK